MVLVTVNNYYSLFKEKRKKVFVTVYVFNFVFFQDGMEWVSKNVGKKK